MHTDISDEVPSLTLTCLSQRVQKQGQLPCSGVVVGLVVVDLHDGAAPGVRRGAPNPTMRSGGALDNRLLQ